MIGPCQRTFASDAVRRLTPSYALLDSIADDEIAYTTDICTRTQPVLYAVDDFDQLGDARELAPLSKLPDRGLVESMRPQYNEAPRACGGLTDAKIWRVLPQPPENSAKLIAVLESTPDFGLPKDPALEYREYWFATEDGRFAFCRVPTDEKAVCGRADIQFQPNHAKRVQWSIGESGVSTYCPGMAK